MTMRTLVAVAALAVLPLAPPNQSATSPQGKTRPFKQYTHRAVPGHDVDLRARRSRTTSRASCSRRTRPASGTPTPCRSPAARGRRSRRRRPTRPTPSRSFRNDDRILLTRDQGGNELNHLYVRTPAGEERDLTPGDKLKAQFARLDADGAAFYVSTNERDPKFFDIYRYDAKSYARTLLFENKDGYFPSEVSDDGKWVSLRRSIRRTTATCSCGMRRRSKTDGCPSTRVTRRSRSAGFDRASKYLYYVTNDGGEFSALAALRARDGRHEDVHKSDWDVTFTILSKRGRYRAIGVNADGRPQLSIRRHVDRRARCRCPPSPTPASRPSGSRAARTKAALYVNGDRSPNNLYVLDLESYEADAG